MATATATALRTKAKAKSSTKEYLFSWEGKDKRGKFVKGDMAAPSEAIVSNVLRRQGILGIKVKRSHMGRKKRVTEKDITLFTRQLATMLKSGVPLIQAFDIVAKGHANPSVTRLLLDIKTDVESGTALAIAFGSHPLYFDDLYCNLVAVGEQAGILDDLLARLATYKEKMLAIKSKIKSALFYPCAVIVVAAIVIAVIMLFVIPAFEETFKSFGAELPAPTQFVVNLSNIFVQYWYLIFGVTIGGTWFFFYTWKRSVPMQKRMDRLLLKLPVFGDLIRKSVFARWSRTLATMFAAGVPLVEALSSVGGASGNDVYKEGTKAIQAAVSTGTSLTNAVQNTDLFPNMVVQMIAIGEEAGSLDDMLGKIADFYEQEVDDAVAALSSLMEPMIMVVLGVLIGGMVIAMYLPIFKIGGVV